jgi:hypothetical protein
MGYFVIGLGFPIFPLSTARIRIIVTASHTNEHIDGLIKCFKIVAEEAAFHENMVGYLDKVKAGEVSMNPNWWKPLSKKFRNTEAATRIAKL